MSATHPPESPDPNRFQDPARIRRILATTRTIAIVGLSTDPTKESSEVARYLKSAGYVIVPVNPKADSILGERSYPSLESIPFPIDMVDVFRRLPDCLQVAHEAAAIKAKSLWLQLELNHPEAARVAEAAGLSVVMDRCTKIEHQRYFAGTTPVTRTDQRLNLTD